MANMALPGTSELAPGRTATAVRRGPNAVATSASLMPARTAPSRSVQPSCRPGERRRSALRPRDVATSVTLRVSDHQDLMIHKRPACADYGTFEAALQWLMAWSEKGWRWGGGIGAPPSAS